MVGWLSTESGGILEMQYVDDGLVHAVRDCILCSAVFPSKTSPVCKQQHSVSTSMHDASQIDAWSLCNNTQEELQQRSLHQISTLIILSATKDHTKSTASWLLLFLFTMVLFLLRFFRLWENVGDGYAAHDVWCSYYSELEVWYCHCCCCFCVCFCWFFCCCCYLAHEVLVLLLFRAWSVGSLQVIMRPDAT